MEKRQTKRLAGVSEVSLTSLSGEVIARASISDLSEGGMLIAYLPADKMAGLAPGRSLGFAFVLPTGPVQGIAKIVRAESGAGELALRLSQIENEPGLHNLLSFLHSWFCGVD